MAKKGQRKCFGCGRFFDFESFGFFADAGTEDDGKPICDICYGDDHAEPRATLLFWDGDEDTEKGSIGHYSINAEYFEELAYAYALRFGWHSTDGWRGYFGGKDFEDWVKVLDSWFGTIGGHTHGDTELENFHRRWETEKARPDFPVFVAFPLTSNVCSCGIEVYVKKENKEDFAKWLES